MMSSVATPVVIVVMNILLCIVAVVLAVGRDIGKNKSLAMVWVIVGIKVVNLIYALTITSFVADRLFIIAEVGVVSTAIIYCIMMIGKYRDKTIRGTK